MRQEFQGVVTEVRAESIEIEFDFDGFPEYREYRLADLRLANGTPEKYDKVRGVWLLELLPASPGMNPDQIARWKKEHRWERKRKKRARRAEPILPEDERDEENESGSPT